MMKSSWIPAQCQVTGHKLMLDQDDIISLVSFKTVALQQWL